MTSAERLTTIKQRDRAHLWVRRATAMAAMGAAVGGAVLTVELATPKASHTASTAASSVTSDDDVVAPTTTTVQGSATSSGGS